MTKTTMAMKPWLSLALFLGCHTPLAASSSLPQSGILVNGSTGSITFPLIPHHVQRARRGLVEDEQWDERTNHSGDGYRRRRTVAQSEAAATEEGGVSTHPEQMGALYMGYGTHYVDLWVGTPPQRQTVIVDTGSSQTAFPCGGCKDCGYPSHHLSAYFANADSGSFEHTVCDECSRKATCNTREQRCEIEQYYSEGSSWEAYEAKDTSYVGGFHNAAVVWEQSGSTEDINPSHAAAFGFPLRFGCQFKVTGLFETQMADGILGMCDGKSAFWHQMYRARKIQSKQFSLCFGRQVHTSKEGTQAGAMTLGGTDERLHASPMVYTTTMGTSSVLPRKQKSGYFDVHVRKLYLRAGSGGEAAKTRDTSAIVLELKNAEDINEEGGVIVDSGTTDSYFSNVIQQSLRQTFMTLTGGTGFNHDRTKLTDTRLAALPTLLIQMAGDVALNKAVADHHGGARNVPGLAGDLDPTHPLDVIVAVPPSHYMEHLSGGYYQNRIYATETDGTVLGANTMMGHDLLFDPTRNRIGWAESSCDYTELVTKNGFPDVLGDELVTVETKETIEEEEEEEEEQEDLKEAFDEKQVETEIQNEEEMGEKVVPQGDSVESTSSLAENKMHQEESKEAFDEEEILEGTETEKKVPSSFGGSAHNFDIPLDDLKQQLTDNPAMAGGGISILVLLSCCLCVCMYRCCCARRTNKSYRRAPEIELNGSSYKDDFQDDYDDDDDDYNDDADEYGDVI